MSEPITAAAYLHSKLPKMPLGTQLLVSCIMNEFAQLSSGHTDEQIAQWREKAEKWDKLDERIASCYGDYDEDGEWVPHEDHKGPDLGDIGEIAASTFGYL